MDVSLVSTEPEKGAKENVPEFGPEFSKENLVRFRKLSDDSAISVKVSKLNFLND